MFVALMVGQSVERFENFPPFPTFDINSLLYSLFHIRMTKISQDQLENFKRIEKKIGNSSVNPITAF